MIYKDNTVLAYLGIGSNIGDRLTYIKKGIRAVDNLNQCRVVEMAPIYETRPHGEIQQPNFFNTVIAVETTYRAHELLKELQKIETDLHRIRIERWGPRTIDIDILFYGSTCIEENDLVIPHPRIQDRDFVLTPMRVLNPRWVHPKLDVTIEELYSKLEEDSAKEVEFS